MDQQEWKKINEIVDKALELKEEERATFIENKCEGDEALRYNVEELLHSIKQSETENFLSNETFPHRLAADFSNDETDDYHSSLVGKTINQYTIKELIGHGGMGSVFLAKRADGAYEKPVALKVLRRGMDTPSNVARFKRERNILASLNHPNIARLLDGGVTESGLPYLVMEYEKGTPLLDYCNKHKLSTEERLELFKSVCKAVQHAHRNAIIHRDLKPSNIYVTDNGDVKVLDFGIAKLLEPDNPQKTLFQTKTGARLLTLGYAAPEQIDNSAITTATDSYTLGLLLYKLLSGIHPFDLGNKELANIENVICTQTADKPSVTFANLTDSEQTKLASRRCTSPSDLIETLRGDLDAIIMKALRKEPESRYPSVEQMLEDLDRYNQSLPLIAQSDTVRYRVGKFMRRNRQTIIGAALTLIAIIGFGSYHVDQITEERNNAKQEAHKAQTVKNFLVDIFRSSNPRSTTFKGKDVSAEQLLLTGGVKINNELNDQPDVYTKIVLAIGDALMGIDAFEEAEKSYQKALAKSSETTQPLEDKLRTHVKLGWLHTDWRESQKQAHKHALDAKKLLEKIESPTPALEASVFSLLGRVLSVREQRELGNSYFEKADRIYVNAGLENTYDYIKMLTGYGRALIYVSDFKKSEEVLLKSNKLHRQKYDNPTLTIAENYKFMAWANRELGNFEKSNDYFLKSTDLKRKLIGGQTVKTALSMYHLARNYTLSGDYKKSEELAKKVLKIYQTELEPSNDYITYAKRYLAIAKSNQNKLTAAEELFREVIKSFNEKYGKDHISFANTGARLAVVYQKTGKFKQAISLLEKCIRINTRELGEQSRAVGVDMLKLADVYRAMENYKMARKYFKKVREIFEQKIPDNHYRRAEFYFKYARLQKDIDKQKKARHNFQKAYNIYLDNFGEDSPRTKNVISYFEQITEA